MIRNILRRIVKKKTRIEKLSKKKVIPKKVIIDKKLSYRSLINEFNPNLINKIKTERFNLNFVRYKDKVHIISINAIKLNNFTSTSSHISELSAIRFNLLEYIKQEGIKELTAYAYSEDYVTRLNYLFGFVPLDKKTLEEYNEKLRSLKIDDIISLIDKDHYEVLTLSGKREIIENKEIKKFIPIIALKVK